MKSLLIVCAFILCSCSSKEQRQLEWDNSIYNGRISLINDFTYHKDTRTNLCFVVAGYGYGQTITNVPCSPEVEKLIKK